MQEGSTMQKAVVVEAAQEAENEINLTPMLDVVFIMLIFFLVVASFVKEAGIDVNRPDATVKPVPQSESILIAIAEDNEIWMDSRLIDPRAVRANIERKHAENPNAVVVIQADKHSSNNALVRVMDASRQAGIYNISLAAGEQL